MVIRAIAVVFPDVPAHSNGSAQQWPCSERCPSSPTRNLSAEPNARPQAAAEFLKGEDIDLVFCSPLDRAKYGAERIAESRGLSTFEDDGFR